MIVFVNIKIKVGAWHHFYCNDDGAGSRMACLAERPDVKRTAMPLVPCRWLREQVVADLNHGCHLANNERWYWQTAGSAPYDNVQGFPCSRKFALYCDLPSVSAQHQRKGKGGSSAAKSNTFTLPSPLHWIRTCTTLALSTRTHRTTVLAFLDEDRKQ